jgi:hypothetical protein
MEQMDQAADHADLVREAKEGAATKSIRQDAELTRGRVTPRPAPEGDLVLQKDTLDSILINVLAKKCDDTGSSMD